MGKNALSITRKQNFADWYQEVITKAELADNSATRGCMVIRPYGYAIWENIKAIFDKMIKDAGVQNAYFPLLIPLEFIEKEAAHIEGFAKECAVVTHHRLKSENGKLIPDGKLENPYIIRPTSETIIGDSFAKWIQSYRDLPMKINQWANVMRWEMRTRMFLRTSEFLWQEGHNVFESYDEAEADAIKMLFVYQDLLENHLCINGILGKKTECDKFPGAANTYTIESYMQDGKALQSCTSHNLGQNFTRSSDIKFMDRDGEEQYGYSTSWGISTRIIGGLIMSHSDDDGLVLPPSIAPYKAVIIPIIHDETRTGEIMDYCNKLKLALGDDILIDDSFKSNSDKKWGWIRKGVPIRIEIGGREVDDNKVFFARRDALMEKGVLSFEEFTGKFQGILDDMQSVISKRNKAMIKDNIIEINRIEDLENIFKKSSYFISIPSDFYKDERLETLMQKYSFSYRCQPMDNMNRLIIAKSY